MLKLFSDPGFLPTGAALNRLLTPFWGNPDDNENYHDFARSGREHLRLTGPEEADVAALPFEGGLCISEEHSSRGTAGSGKTGSPLKGSSATSNVT